MDDGGNDDGPDSQPTQSSGPTQPSQELLPEREFELAKAEEEEMSEILRKEEEEKKRIREEVERKRNEREEQLRKREEERKAQQDREDAERKSRIAELQKIHAKTPAKKRTQKASKGGLKRAKKEEDLSEYERIREENIKEREQLMAQLGVTPISSLSTPSKRAPKRVQTAESPLAPKTKSTRLEQLNASRAAKRALFTEALEEMEVFADDPQEEEATSQDESQPSQPLDQSQLTPDKQSYLDCKAENDRLIAENPEVSQRTEEQKTLIQKNQNRMKKLAKRIRDVSQLITKKPAMSNTPM